MRIPEGFRLAGAGALVRRGYEGELLAWRRCAGEGPSGALGVGGRGASTRARLGDGAYAFVRRYRHGGFLGAVLGEAYFGHPPRPWRELVATEAARRAGVLAPEVLAAVVEPYERSLFGVPYRGVLVTREIAERRLLRDALAGASSEQERRGWIAAASAAVQQLHACGVSHPDLNVTNLLVGRSLELPIAIIDFDRAVARTSPVGPAGRWMARRRLARSIAKLKMPGLGRSDCRRLLSGIVRGGPR